MTAATVQNVQAPTPVAQPTTAQTTAAQPQARQAKPSLGTVSIKLGNIPKPTVPHIATEVKPLTQADLEHYWSEAIAELGLPEEYAAHKVTLREHGMFDIEASNTYFEIAFKPHQVDVMSAIRQKSGIPMLNCRIVVLKQTSDAKVYQPSDKYEAMLKINPALASLRSIFTEIDY